MKITVVLDGKGELVAAQLGTTNERGRDAGLVPGPDQKLHIIDVPDDLGDMSDPSRFSSRMQPHLPKG